MARAGWRSAACFLTRRSSPTISASSGRCTPTRRRTPRVACQMNTGSILIGKPCSGLVALLRTGHVRTRTCQLRGDDGSSRRADRQRLELDRRLHAGRVQGTLFRSGGTPLARPRHSGRHERSNAAAFAGPLEGNEREAHAARPDETELAARIQSYELAYRMQTAAAEAVDLDRESPQTRAMYGLDNAITADFGRKCLITRRLLERGVRFVQLYSGGGHIEDTWDGHNDCITNHKLHAGETDQPIAALIDGPEAHRSMGRNAAGLGRRVRPNADQRRSRQTGPRPRLARL